MADVTFPTHKEAASARVRSVLQPGTKPVRITWVVPNQTDSPTASSSHRPPSFTAKPQEEDEEPQDFDQELAAVKAKLQAREKAAAAAMSLPAKIRQSLAGTSKGRQAASSSAPPRKHLPARQTLAPSVAPVVPVNASVPQPLSKAEIGAQLRRLFGKQAPTLYDKYVLLEERDKILRKGRARRGDVRRAVAQTGTCVDMCPEKERYIREVQNRMSDYELLPSGSVDPSKCVKDYSRSSADQEEPLSHELRPGPVLSRTMAYLYSRVADGIPGVEEEARLAAWYHFLWNRTRAIRKVTTASSSLLRLSSTSLWSFGT